MLPRKAHIYCRNDFAGILQETPESGTIFTYNSDYTESIACILPRHQNNFSWQYGLHPFFENLAPEGWLRDKQAKASNLQPLDSFGLLLLHGQDCIGAVGVRDITTTTSNNLSNPNFDVETRAASTNRTLSGVQRKLLAYKNANTYHLADTQNAATHIAKFNNIDNNTLIRNEFLSLAFAASVLGKDQVTKFETTRISELDEPALLIERFDRTGQGHKLRMEEFAQILGKPRGSDFQGKYQGSYEEIAAAIRQYSAFPKIDLDRFFRAIVFSILIGNCDAHSKNFALLEFNTNNMANKLRLAPVYDVLNTLLYPEKGYSAMFALEICGKKRMWDTIDRKIVLEFAKNIGLTDQACSLALEDIAHNIKKSKILEPHELADQNDFKVRYKEIVDRACIKILD